MADGKTFGKIAHATLTKSQLQFGDGFHVILSQLGRVIAASSLVAFRSCTGFFH
jgi:hypothetical protein